ncbi:transcriptional regulator, partial [Streptomyces sp. SID625]|nr:transcriptional regulator [Streptomyces sp. SID625]
MAEGTARRSEGSGDPLAEELVRLLERGPFADALRAAITASGLSLDRIRDRLVRRGASLSVATLSSWQS